MSPLPAGPDGRIVDLTGARRLVLVGAGAGLAWSCALRGWMAAVAGPGSTVTWAGTLGGVLALAPLAVPGVLATLVSTGQGSGALGMVSLAMLAGHSLSGRGSRWRRSAAGLLGFAVVPAVWLAPPITPQVEQSTPAGAIAALTFSTLFVGLAVACAIPMRDPAPAGEGQVAPTMPSASSP